MKLGMTVHKLQTGNNAPLSEEEFIEWQGFWPTYNFFQKRAAEGKTAES
jgi:hypothetical protein